MFYVTLAKPPSHRIRHASFRASGSPSWHLRSGTCGYPWGRNTTTASIGGGRQTGAYQTACDHNWQWLENNEGNYLKRHGPSLRVPPNQACLLWNHSYGGVRGGTLTSPTPAVLQKRSVVMVFARHRWQASSGTGFLGHRLHYCILQICGSREGWAKTNPGVWRIGFRRATMLR